MSSGEREIVCRRCQESIPLEEDNCPHCGASVRNRGRMYAAVVLGLLIAGTSLFQIGTLWFFGLIGLALAAVGGYLLYDRRQRIQQAVREAGGVVGVTGESDGS